MLAYPQRGVILCRFWKRAHRATNRSAPLPISNWWTSSPGYSYPGELPMLGKTVCLLRSISAESADGNRSSGAFCESPFRLAVILAPPLDSGCSFDGKDEVCIIGQFFFAAQSRMLT